MSGDSPTHNNRTVEAFDFSSTNPEGRPQLLESKPLTNSEPVATTSKESAIPSSRPEEKAGKTLCHLSKHFEATLSRFRQGRSTSFGVGGTGRQG